MHWLAYVHPAVMTIVLGLGILVAREGVRLRQSRLIRRTSDSRRHRTLGRLFVAAVAVGFGVGLASMGLLRDEPVYDSFHSALATGGLAGLTLAYLLGRSLERRPDPRVRLAHLVCGSVGLLLALVAAAAGMAILP